MFPCILDGRVKTQLHHRYTQTNVGFDVESLSKQSARCLTIGVRMLLLNIIITHIRRIVVDKSTYEGSQNRILLQIDFVLLLEFEDGRSEQQ